MTKPSFLQRFPPDEYIMYVVAAIMVCCIKAIPAMGLHRKRQDVNVSITAKYSLANCSCCTVRL